MKKLTALILTLATVIFVFPLAYAVEDTPIVDVPSYILIERETGTILCENNSHEQLAPASVTKIMTLLLIAEAIEDGRLSLDDTIVTSTNASQMGGSQIYLRENEQMSCEDMLKSVIISSANDAAVALAEHLYGSVESFVDKMNQRAAELGMNDTCFKNCTGLPAQGHVTSAYDISLMSRELLKHDVIRQYTTIWMDSVRDGEFGLTNTNRLVRFYEGTTGLKTGFTTEAMYCMSASAERNGMELICVIMKAPTSDERFEAAKSLLNYGFSNYALIDVTTSDPLPEVSVKLGVENSVPVELSSSSKILIDKSLQSEINTELELDEIVDAPVEAGQKLGELHFVASGNEIATVDIVASKDVYKLGWFDIFTRLLGNFFTS